MARWYSSSERLRYCADTLNERGHVGATLEMHDEVALVDVVDCRGTDLGVT